MSIEIEDASGYRGYAERWVAPASLKELSALLAEATATLTPVTISGAGTGITGGRCPSGGWAVSLEKFKTLEIRAGRAVAGAGISLRELQEAAARTGQFYAPDPTEWTASLGGTIATNASGSRSFRYGATRRHVAALTVVFMDGTVRRFERGERVDFPFTPVPAPATTKCTAGYALHEGLDWVDLLCGSEGTLAVVAETEIELLKQPRERLSGVVFFRDDRAALAAVDGWRGIAQLNMLEYMDEPSLELLRPRYGTDIPASAHAALLVEQDLDGLGGDAVDEWVERLEESGGLEESWFGDTASDRERFRAFRHALPELVNERVRRNGVEKLGSDFAVPVARNGEMLGYYRSTLEAEFGGRHALYGHIGDAHVHANILSEKQDEFARGRAWLERAAKEAVRLGGTVSAEHGLGRRKRHLLALQFTNDEIESMCAVKRRLDPLWLLGRGILLPEPVVTD